MMYKWVIMLDDVIACFFILLAIISCLWTKNCNHGPALRPNICRVWHGYILLMKSNWIITLSILNFLFLYRERHREVLVFFAEHGYKPTNLLDPKNSQCFYVPLIRLLFLLLLSCLPPFTNEEWYNSIVITFTIHYSHRQLQEYGLQL